MMFTYKLSPNFLGQPNSTIIRSDDTFIPPDPGNTDYQAYLKWIEEGNSPYPADSATPLPAENT